MTTYELAERLARRLKKGSLPLLSPAATQDIVEAINAGLQECYELLPAWQRKTTLSVELPAPVAVSVGVTTGAVALSSGTFTTAQIGRSVVLAGDTEWNQVAGLTTLLDKYQGTTGTVAGTVYGDALSNALTNWDGFTSHPTLANTRETLVPWNARAARQPGMVGRPLYYWIEPAAASLGSSPVALLRIYPAPDVAYVLRIDAEFRPAVITFSDVHVASTIPLGDQLLHRCLLPLCEEALLRSSEWANDSKAHLVAAAADTARDFISRQRSSVGTPANRVFTPPGY